MNCIACDFVIGKTQGSSTSSSFFLTVDSQSVDIFQDVDTREPMQSIPISTVLVKVSVRDATVMLLQEDPAIRHRDSRCCQIQETHFIPALGRISSCSH